MVSVNVQLRVMIIIIVFFFIMIPCSSTTPIQFNFTSFYPSNPNIIYEQSARVDVDVIQLTQDQQNLSIGRATYAQPLHLWDRDSGNLSDFTTNFTFVIDSHRIREHHDGIAFFLAPNGSKIPDNAIGWSFGLMNYSSNSPFVAIEFDTYANRECRDPRTTHVGIDNNSMRSVTFVKWWANFTLERGRKHEARISYRARTMNLSVVFTDYINHTWVRNGLSTIINLPQSLPEFVTFGFSAATSNSSASHTLHSWSFESIGLYALDTNTTAPSNSLQTSKQAKHKTVLFIASAVGGSMFLLVLGLLIYYFQNKRKTMMSGVDETYEFEQYNGPKKFAYKDLKLATNNFKQENKLGQGGFGNVYKGFLKGIDSFVAVKRISSDSNQGTKEYASEVKIISTLRHRNMVRLLGWCHENKQLLIVYEFMPNGSLDCHLFKGKSLLTWRIRFKIAQGLASALLYLHEEWEQCILHRDIKSSNVMLDADFNTKLGDFGLARLVDHEKGSATTTLAGTMGYMAPECLLTFKASKETDVFSFGVVSLEIACGRKPIDHMALEENRVNLVEWVWSLYGEGKLLDAADSKLNAEFNSREMEQLMIVGLWCAHPDSNSRPSIRQAVLLLNFEASPPLLPLKMPEPNYMTAGDDMMCYGTNTKHTESSYLFPR